MTLFPSRALAAVLVLLSGISAGALAFAQQHKEVAKQTPMPVQAEPAVPVLHLRMSLLEARIETARQIVNEDLDRLRLLVNSPESTAELIDQISVWSRRLMEDRLRRAATPEERLAAIREHRTRMVSHEQLARRYAAAGQARSSDALIVKYYRLEADQLLAEAGADPAKEPPILEPKGDGAPPPPPPSPR